MGIGNLERECGRDDKTCPPTLLWKDIELARDDFGYSRIIYLMTKTDPNSDPKEVEDLRHERNIYLVELRSKQEKVELILKGEDPTIKLCETCPFKKRSV